RRLTGRCSCRAPHLGLIGGGDALTHSTMGPNASAARSVQPFAPRKWGGSGTEAAARADPSNARSRAPSPLGADPHLPSYSLVKQPTWFPRRVLAPGFCFSLRSPGMRGGRTTER